MDPASRERGRKAEDEAASYLRKLGFEILARNLRTRSGEIDVVARDGGTVVIVEVRYRRNHVVDAWRSLSHEKHERLIRAAREALRKLRIPRTVPVRVDVVLASAESPVTHIRGALSASRPYPP